MKKTKIASANPHFDLALPQYSALAGKLASRIAVTIYPTEQMNTVAKIRTIINNPAYIRINLRKIRQNTMFKEGNKGKPKGALIIDFNTMKPTVNPDYVKGIAPPM